MPASRTVSLLNRYKLRIRRKRLLWRAFQKRREFACIQRKTGSIKGNDILLFACLRNEMQRLPHFVEHYRQAGIDHFLFVDNGSSDGSVEFLRQQPDVSIWQTEKSYKASRFGMDWITALQWKYGADHWCVTVDIDELFIYPDWPERNLKQLTADLAKDGCVAMGAMMLDLFPKGPLSTAVVKDKENPVKTIPWFDASGYFAQKHQKMGNVQLQGGPRTRCFFANDPYRGPTLNKVPLVFWRKPYVYVDSTHIALPAHLNRVYDTKGARTEKGVLLHTKFLSDAPERANQEKSRQEHFAYAGSYDDYYDAVAGDPDLWANDSVRFESAEQLISLGLMGRADHTRR